MIKRNSETWYLDEYGDIFDEFGKCLSVKQTRMWKSRWSYVLDSLINFYSRQNKVWNRLINEGTPSFRKLGYVDKYIAWPILFAMGLPILLPLGLLDSKSDLEYIRDDNRYRLQNSDDPSALINRDY